MIKEKLVLLGASSAGKTSFVQRFVQNAFEAVPSTIGAAFQCKTVTINDKSITFEIWDTAGQERYAAIAPIFYRTAKFVVVIYDVTDINSFERAKQWVSEVQQANSVNRIIALCANKCDLPKQDWQVESEFAHEYAESNNLLFFQTSAKEGHNIEQTFKEVAQEYINTTKIKVEPEFLDTTVVNESGKGCC
ncbi:Rab1a [Hexamita inflata]|uniref:Rab1a n=1 Tax=Hexamita inflata TaxID=28002 RepID=A0AA86TJB3_9EUKA|nr:Rab1a [Hexamita inflata]